MKATFMKHNELELSSFMSRCLFVKAHILSELFRRLGVKTRHVRMSRFDLFRYVVRLSEAHIVSNSCTSAIISNGVMSKKHKKSKADMRVFCYLCFVCSFKSRDSVSGSKRDMCACRVLI